MELTEKLKLLKSELATAVELEKVQELTGDITRVRRAIMVENELRSGVVPAGKPCGATAVEERRMSTEEQEQQKFEMEYRMAHGETDGVSSR